MAKYYAYANEVWYHVVGKVARGKKFWQIATQSYNQSALLYLHLSLGIKQQQQKNKNLRKTHVKMRCMMISFDLSMIV